MGKNLWRIKVIVLGWWHAAKLIRKYPGTQIVLTLPGVGDRVFMLAYVREYQKYHSIDKLGIITADRDNDLYSCFGIEQNELISIDPEIMDLLNNFYFTDAGYFFRKKHHEILPVATKAYLRVDFYRHCGLFRFDSIVKHIYKIPQTTYPGECKYPAAKQLLKSLCEQDIILPGHTVLINPYANDCAGIPLAFFQKIADRLKECGYRVITSVFKDQKALEGTYGARFPIGDTIALCNICGTVIGARSGFMDFTTFSQARIICIDNLAYTAAQIFLLEDC